MEITGIMNPTSQQSEAKKEDAISVAQLAFIVYVRTLQFLKTRLKGSDEVFAIHIPQSEIIRRFFPFPKYTCKDEITKLIKNGLLELTEGISLKSGNKIFYYKATQDGPIDLYLVKRKPIKIDSDLKKMIEYLQHVTIQPDIVDLPAYFEAFLNFNSECMLLFFTVDNFSGRIHTPVTSLKSVLRAKLLLYEEPTVGIDVVTMQPLLLGNILKQKIGSNEFTTWIESGEDIYSVLQLKSGLESREKAKKRFFEILFAPANNKMAELFGDAEWITWINLYKKQPELRNPHYTLKPHSNLSWLLQSTEVTLMRKVWKALISNNIPFLSVHDEIIVKESNLKMAERVFRSNLNSEFPFFKLSIKRDFDYPIQPDLSNADPKYLCLDSDGLP